MKTMSAEVCQFKRSFNSPLEDGIAINDGAGNYDVKVIIDVNWKLVPTPLHTYHLESSRGCFQFLAETDFRD